MSKSIAILSIEVLKASNLWFTISRAIKNEIIKTDKHMNNTNHLPNGINMKIAAIKRAKKGYLITILAVSLFLFPLGAIVFICLTHPGSDSVINPVMKAVILAVIIVVVMASIWFMFKDFKKVDKRYRESMKKVDEFITHPTI